VRTTTKKTTITRAIISIMEPSVSEPAEKAIDEIRTGEELPSNSTLAGLSGLNAVELSLFRDAWPGIEPERRRQVISRLVEMTEDNLEYNFDVIFRFTLKDTDEDVRVMSIEGLWENEETSLIDPLVEMLEQDESDRVQSAAAISLGKFALLAEFEKLNTESIDKVREALLGAVDDRNKSIEVTRRVLEAVAPLSLPDVKEAIMEAYRSDDPGLRISAIYAMGKSCDREWLPILLRETENYDPEIRYEAAGACGELEEEEAVDALVRLAEEDDDVEVRTAAIQALGKIGTASARQCLNAYLENSNEAIREAAEEALKVLDSSDDPLSFRV
jgi:HEAT repeat protein